jgi:hypothetical protein
MPAIYQWPDMAAEGGLVAYGPPLDRHPVVTHFLPQPWRPTGERSKAQQGEVPIIATGNTHPGETAQGRRS